MFSVKSIAEVCAACRGKTPMGIMPTMRVLPQ